MTTTVVSVREQPFRLSLDRRPKQAGVLRTRLQQWLTEAGVARDEIFDTTLACSEAFANAVRHPLHPTTEIVDVDGRIAGDELVITIRDHGTWRPRSGVEGGLGLPLMRSLMSSAEVKRRQSGTTVVLRRRLDANPAA